MHFFCPVHHSLIGGPLFRCCFTSFRFSALYEKLKESYMLPSSLLCLPNEVLVVILEILQPSESEHLDWRTATVHNDTPKVDDVGIYSIRAVCKRLRDLATPFAFRQFRIWTANSAIFNSDLLNTDTQILGAVRDTLPRVPLSNTSNRRRRA